MKKLFIHIPKNAGMTIPAMKYSKINCSNLKMDFNFKDFPIDNEKI